MFWGACAQRVEDRARRADGRTDGQGMRRRGLFFCRVLVSRIAPSLIEFLRLCHRSERSATNTNARIETSRRVPFSRRARFLSFSGRRTRGREETTSEAFSFLPRHFLYSLAAARAAESRSAAVTTGRRGCTDARSLSRRGLASHASSTPSLLFPFFARSFFTRRGRRRKP
jgi:hypothetical protein